MLLTLLALASLWFVRPITQVRRRPHADVLPVGTDTVISLRVSGGSAMTAHTRWEDTLPAQLTGAARGEFGDVRDRDQNADYTVHATARGVAEVGPLRIWTADGFGLARRARRYTESTTLTIAPEVVDLPAMTRAGGEASGALHSTTSQLGEGADNLIARPYAAGDSMRRIHWRATAHRGEIMVRQEERESTPEALVMIDRSPSHWSKNAHATGADAAFETALSTVVSAAIRLMHEGYTVAVVDADGVALTDPLLDEEDVDAMLAAFARVRPSAHDAVSTSVGGSADGRVGPLVLVSSTSPPPGALVARSSLPVLLAVGAHDAEIASARAAGWNAAAVPIEGGPSIADAWSTAVERGGHAGR